MHDPIEIPHTNFTITSLLKPLPDLLHSRRIIVARSKRIKSIHNCPLFLLF